MKNSKRYTIPPSAISRLQSKTRRGELEPLGDTSQLVGEWQQHGPETISGYVVRKLRLTLAPPQSLATANAVR